MYYDALKDYILYIAFQICSAVYAIVLTVKLIGSDTNLLVNRLIIIVLVADITGSILNVVGIFLFLDSCLNEFLSVKDVNNDYLPRDAFVICFPTFLTYGEILATILAGFVIIPFIVITDLRNSILIRDKSMFLLSRGLILLIALSYIFYMVSALVYNLKYTTLPSSIFKNVLTMKAIFGITGSAFINILDIVSGVYLLIYYNKYYFSSRSIMKHLRFQMIYRRNWIYFVIFISIISLSLVVTSILKIYPSFSLALIKLNLLLQLNTMIDFVKFDMIRNELIIGDDTMYLFDNPTN